jgi:hypothetical protein
MSVDFDRIAWTSQRDLSILHRIGTIGQIERLKDTQQLRMGCLDDLLMVEYQAGAELTSECWCKGWNGLDQDGALEAGPLEIPAEESLGLTPSDGGRVSPQNNQRRVRVELANEVGCGGIGRCLVDQPACTRRGVAQSIPIERIQISPKRLDLRLLTFREAS